MEDLKKGDYVTLNENYKNPAKGLTKGKDYEVKEVSEYQFWITKDDGMAKHYSLWSKVFKKVFKTATYTPGQMEVLSYYTKELINLEGLRHYTTDEQYKKDLEFLKDKYLTMLLVEKEFTNE